MACIRRARAAVCALCLSCCALPLLSGCSVYNSLFHRSHDHGCSEKPFSGNTESVPGLVVPEGLSPPDTRNGIKIPTLNEPERVRAKNEPCLAQPPSYATGTSIAVPVRSGAPMGAPAPAPIPAPVSPVPGPLSPEPPAPGPLTPVPAAPEAPKAQ
jgi:hypothetical protein